MELSVRQKLSALGAPAEYEVWAQLRQLANVTALKRSPMGDFHLGHWWRGPLLYSLVQYHRPRHILEFGTGRGYGALCMGQAAIDGGFECTIWTIDMIPPACVQEWAIDEGEGPEVRRLSLKDVWARHFPPELTRHIHLLTGDSLSVMRMWHEKGFPRIDFCFIDAGHNYWAVKHDFMAALEVAAPGCSFLFDDYTERRRYGVQRLIDEDVIPKLPLEAVEIIDILTRDKTEYGEDVEHKMALLLGEDTNAVTLGRFYSRSTVRWFKRMYGVYSPSRRLALKVKAAMRYAAPVARRVK